MIQQYFLNVWQQKQACCNKPNTSTLASPSQNSLQTIQNRTGLNIEWRLKDFWSVLKSDPEGKLKSLEVKDHFHNHQLDYFKQNKGICFFFPFTKHIALLTSYLTQTHIVSY